MLYNVYDMSTTSTLARPRPALIIPGGGERSPYDNKASMISCHGLPTPPHSALESRRQSLQFAILADYASTTAPTNLPFSQPSTPIRTASGHGDGYGHSWSEHAPTTTNTPSHLVHSFSATHLSQSVLQPSFQPLQPYQAPDVEYHSSYTGDSSPPTAGSFESHGSVPAQSTWESCQQSQQTWAPEVSSRLGPPLFAMSQAFGPEHSAHDPYNIQSGSASYHQQQFQPSIAGFQDLQHIPSNASSQPQVVVPSQLSPLDDLSQRQFHALTSPYCATEDHSMSFSMAPSSLGSFEILRAPSPMSTYFPQSDEEDWVLIKPEATKDSIYHSTTRPPTGSRTRRRGSRRTRSTAANFSHVHYTGNTEVVCDGFNPREGVPSRQAGRSKQHRCDHRHANGNECGRSFDRSEHLKRHSLMHSNIRNYPCPLPKCAKEIQRPDNAADHFKTHLKPKKKGKRNDHFDWPYVRREILNAYCDHPKRANKLIDNLQKWVDLGMPECASQRRGAQQY